MSSVFLAVHVESGHEVALKVLTRTLARHATLLQRFLREAKSAEQLEHPNIVMIYDRGIDQGRHYLALEYVTGGDLHEHVQKHGPLGALEAVAAVKTVAGGLKYAAGRGLIHRDIKPSNLLRTESGHIKIIDLGLALQNEAEDERVTREGTTVGTVDYMAPEQARDSRATSIQSDIYSLGCTFYYLLTGVAPFPGGDITEKLTRHAKTPPPNVCDLRPDVPATIGSIIQRMMAKRPDDRFASYDDLLAALDAVPLKAADGAPAVALVPLAGDELDAVRTDEHETRQVAAGAGQNGLGDSAFDLAPLAELAGDELRRARTARDLPKVIARQSMLDQWDEPDPYSPERAAPVRARGRSGAGAATAWAIAGGLIGVAFVMMILGVLQFNDSAGVTAADSASSADVAESGNPEPSVATAVAPVRAPVAPKRGESAKQAALAIARARVTPQVEVPWAEPADSEPAPGEQPVAPLPAPTLKDWPAWARMPIPARVEGPLVVVRRIADAGDPSAVSSLRAALDGATGGTIQLADEGPHVIDDARIPGESRMIRARSGLRPIVHIERSPQDAVRERPAVFTLERNNVILDGLDVVVDANDLSRRQTALFACFGASLTLRNCTITVFGGSGSPLELFQVNSSGTRSTRIHLVRTLVRGHFGAAVAMTGGSADLVLEESLILGSSGPLINVRDAAAGVERRVFLSHSLLAGPGAIIARGKSAGLTSARPILFRTFGSAFGRLNGTGIPSIISSFDSTVDAAKQIDWAGDENVYADWKGFFASGSDSMVRLPDLAAARSAWPAAESKSQEVLVPWPQPAELAAAVAQEFVSVLPRHADTLRQVAQPRKCLFERTVGVFAPPVVPEPAGLPAQPAQATGAAIAWSPHIVKKLNSVISAQGEPGLVASAPAPKAPTPKAPTPGGVAGEITFSTDTPPWNGDLGAFLRDGLSVRTKHTRVRVVGSGSYYFTPVVLPPGTSFEVRVETLPGTTRPTWSPRPQATGPALIKLDGGSLRLSNLVLRHDPAARLEHLIDVENGHLLLSHCELTAPAATDDFPGDLIRFRSATTAPLRENESATAIFASKVDRQVCRLIDSTLITGGCALEAELARGLVALSQCAIAAGRAAFALMPSKVARDRFAADLVLDHCTMASERAIVRMGPWPSLGGPDRPLLISSRNCAFLATYDRRVRETVLLRSDTDSLAKGAVFWQAGGDAADVDCFIATGEGPSIVSRQRDARKDWMHFWGKSHITGVTGPRSSAGGTTVRLFERLHPGHIEPADLVLDPASRHDVGADLARQGIMPPPARAGRQRN
jgi:eukaryotic-like serine/threonine-protein kinase